MPSKKYVFSWEDIYLEGKILKTMIDNVPSTYKADVIVALCSAITQACTSKGVLFPEEVLSLLKKAHSCIRKAEREAKANLGREIKSGIKLKSKGKLGELKPIRLMCKEKE